jgi:hypothetical protein
MYLRHARGDRRDAASGRSLLSAASSTAGLARLVAAHITLAWAGDAASAAQVRGGKLLA